MRPSFGTLPLTTVAVPDSIASMIRQAYSSERVAVRSRADSSSARIREKYERSRSSRRPRSSEISRKPNRSMSSARVLKYGTYSDMCRVDSVTKYPKRRMISNRTVSFG